jgi:hypothetical protein
MGPVVSARALSSLNQLQSAETRSVAILASSPFAKMDATPITPPGIDFRKLAYLVLFSIGFCGIRDNM